jgi:hypothetical protein
VAIETFVTGQISHVVMTGYALIRDLLYLVRLGEFVGRDHDVELFRNWYRLGEKIVRRSDASYSKM